MKSIKILFQGDSITDGGRGRSEDPNHILGHSYAYIAASALGFKYPERIFEFLNKGISGNTSADLYARWQADALNLKPDFISVLIGTNDAGQEINAPQDVYCDRFAVTIELILKQTQEVLPDTRIILMEPFMLNTGNLTSEVWECRRQALRNKQKAVKDIAEDRKCLFIPLQQRFNEASKKRPEAYWIWDSVHPTYAGHGLIADAWVRDTRNYFNY